MTLQKRWDRPHCPRSWATKEEASWNGEAGWKDGSEAPGKILKENALSSSFLLFSFNLKVAFTGKHLHLLPSPLGLALDLFTGVEK